MHKKSAFAQLRHNKSYRNGAESNKAKRNHFANFADPHRPGRVHESLYYSRYTCFYTITLLLSSLNDNPECA